MNTLRDRVIRLAYHQPGLRDVLLPLLRTAGAVKVQVDAAASEKMRKDWPGEGAIISGVFKSSIPLYRAVDGGEMHRILSTKKVEGGFFSISPERSGGASWGADKQEVIKFGLNWQSRGRLGGKLFLLETDGKGKPFVHLNQPSVDLSQGDHVTTIDAASCSTGLGCSLIVPVRSVKSIKEIQAGGHLADISGPELAQLAKGEAETPRLREVYNGWTLAKPPRGLLKALQDHSLSDSNAKALFKLKDKGGSWLQKGWSFDEASARRGVYVGQYVDPNTEAPILVQGEAPVSDTAGTQLQVETVGLKNVSYWDKRVERWVNVWSSLKPLNVKLP